MKEYFRKLCAGEKLTEEEKAEYDRDEAAFEDMEDAYYEQASE